MPAKQADPLKTDSFRVAGSPGSSKQSDIASPLASISERHFSTKLADIESILAFLDRTKILTVLGFRILKVPRENNTIVTATLNTRRSSESNVDSVSSSREAWRHGR